ncbi:MAG: 30S ribosomal protein S20 [Candidatus Sumerlaeota bacterium]|nr:30S ribosomal protein S20 [Candidatus Sumerlaeota bacterium]
MPNIKSAVKRMRTNRKRQARNRAAKSAMKTAVKKVVTSTEAGELEAAKSALPAAVSLIDKTAKKKIIHKRAAARKVSRLMKRLNRAQAQASGEPAAKV